MKVTTSGFKGISFLPCNYYEKDLFLNCILGNGAKMRVEWTRESTYLVERGIGQNVVRMNYESLDQFGYVSL